jgi:hypothetical protein
LCLALGVIDIIYSICLCLAKGFYVCSVHRGHMERLSLVVHYCCYRWLWRWLCVCCCVCIVIATTQSSSADKQPKFYIYDWPEISTNQYSKVKNDLDPHFVANHGAGPVVDEGNGFYNTWQFALFQMVYQRLRADIHTDTQTDTRSSVGRQPRRTLNPEEADTFILPYDYGLDACFRPDNGKMRKINCPLAAKVTERLYASKYFNASHGHNHVLIVSVNQNMNYFLSASNCQQFLAQTCYNCTKLAIDEYSWLHSINRYEAALRKRGDYWHAIPFPANIHYHTRMQQPYPWQQAFAHKDILVSYTGSLSSYNVVSKRFRKAIGINCQEYFNMSTPDGLTTCVTNKYVSPHQQQQQQQHAAAKHTHQAHSITHPRHAKHQPTHTSLPLYCRSIFCFQPPGDMPTRKSVFDSILCGCIPVFFNRLTASLMYEWHWDMDTWDQASVFLDWDNNALTKEIYKSYEVIIKNPNSTQTREERVDMIKILLDMYNQQRELVYKKQQVIADNAIKLQYSIHVDANNTDNSNSHNMNKPLNEIVDAYDIAIDNVLAIHTGRRSHARVAHYMVCEDKHSYNVDWCVSTNSTVDVWKEPQQ